MKLVVATPLYPPEPGGPATYAKLLAEGLPERGIEVEMVKFGDVRHLPRLLRHVVYSRRVLAAARAADAVLALDPVSTGLPAARAARAAGKPFFVKIVGDYAWEQGSRRFGVSLPLDEFVRTRQPALQVRILQKVQTRVAKVAARVIVPSQYLKGIVMAWGIPEEHIEVIYNSVSLPAAIPAPPERPEGFLVVSSGRAVPWKGFEALKRVVAREPSWHLRIISNASPEEALGWVRTADVFVLNSTYEGFSHTLIEAIMLGTPVIATRVGGNPELITDGVTGILVPPQDDDALFAAIAQVAENAAAARARAAAAQKDAARFTPTAMLEKTATFIQSHLGHGVS